MKTRRFKALNGYGKDSEIVDKIAIYDDNDNQIDCCLIQTDSDKREYYYPTNPHDEDGLFLDKPKDAIECIRNGFGDIIQRSKTFDFAVEHVVRFIDREYGETLRNLTLDEWKNTKFVYGIKFIDSFGDRRIVMKNKALMRWETVVEPLSFDSEEHAISFINDVTEKASKYCNEYNTLTKEGYYEDVAESFFNSIEGKVEHGVDSIYWRAFCKLYEERLNIDPKCKMEIIQIVKTE